MPMFHTNMDVDVIIPIYKPDDKFLKLMERLDTQTVKPKNVIIMNTEKKYFDRFTSEFDFCQRFPNARIHHINKDEFDHGGTRRRAVRCSESPVFVMMTQDAVPADDRLIEKLLEGLAIKSGPDIAVAYARQLADDRCGVLETASRQFNYPDKSATKTKADLERLGIKTYFCSDVCAAYRRDIYDRLGGFVRHTLFNEDMIFAAEAVNNGYGVRYQADAKVIHSHNYSNSQQFHRNFDLGVSQAQHPEVFENISSESEGKKLVISTTGKLIRTKNIKLLPHFYAQCASKYAGFVLGRHYKKLSDKAVMKFTTNPGYFINEK